MHLGVLIISIITIILSGCSKYEKVSKTNFTLGKISISASISNGFLAGKRNHSNPTQNIVWSESITNVDASITKELASGSWTFYGYVISEDTIYCAIQNEELLSSSQTVNVIYSTAKCLDKKLFSHTGGEFDFVLCTEFNPEDPECFNNRSSAGSIRLTSLGINLSSISDLQVNTNAMSDSGCIELIEGKTPEDLDRYIQTSSNLPIPGAIQIFSDSECQIETSKISFDYFLFENNFINKDYLSDGYLLVLDAADSKCTSNDSCPTNHECVSGECLSSVGASCTSDSPCVTNNCEENVCAYIATGSTCENSSQCLLGNCEDNLCLPKILGELCFDSTECASGYCETTCQQTSLFFNGLAYNNPYDEFGEENGDNYLLLPTSQEGNTLGVSENSDFSISLWFKTNMRNTGILFGQKEISGNSAGQIGLAINGAPYGPLKQTNIIRLLINDKDNNIPSKRINEIIDLNDHSLILHDFHWHHLVITRKENQTEGSVTLKTFFDSIQVASVTMSVVDFPSPSSQQFFLGGKALYADFTKSELLSGLYFIGEMDEFAIFDSALTDEEVSVIHDDNRGRDLRYNFSGFNSSHTLKTYFKMNIDPNSEGSFITFKSSDDSFNSLYEGFVKNDLTRNADLAPNTFINEDNFSIVDINYKELEMTTSGFTCHNPIYPPSNAVDGKLDNFSHTLQACNTSNQFFYFQEIIYLSNIEIIARGGADRRLRKLDFKAYANDGVTTNFHFHDETETYLNNQEINFAQITAGVDYLKLLAPSSAEFNFVNGFSSVNVGGERNQNSLINHQNLSQLIDTNKFEIERIADDYYFAGQGYTASQQIDDEKVLQIAELKAYGLEASVYEGLQEDCENGSRDYFETDVDCGGNFCPTLGVSGKCLENEYCLRDRDCLSSECVNNSCTSPPGYSNGNFEAFPTNISLESSRYDTTSLPIISVASEVGLTTQLCGDSNCNLVLGEVDHTSEQMEITPSSGLADGEYSFYVRNTNNRDDGQIIGPINYTKFTPDTIDSQLINIRASSSWNYDERSERLIDSAYNEDFGTGSENNELDLDGTFINRESQHYIDIILEKTIWLSGINLFNRSECCFDRINDIDIVLYDDNNQEISSYYNLNDYYFSDPMALQGSNFSLDLTMNDSALFGFGQTKEVKRIKIIRNWHTGQFPYPDNEAKVQLGFSEISLMGLLPDVHVQAYSLSAPTSFTLLNNSMSSDQRPEFVVVNSVGNFTQLCEDENCTSVIGWVEHQQSTETFTPMFDLPAGDYTFYFRSSKNTDLSETVGSLSYTIYTPTAISNNDITISGTTNWPGEPLHQMIDGNLTTIGSTGIPEIDDINDINHLGHHKVILEFSEEKIINEIQLTQRTNCCYDRIMDYDIKLYREVNGVEVEIADYYSNNNNRLFCEDRQDSSGSLCSFQPGSTISFHIDGDDIESFGLGEEKQVTKIEIIRYKNTDQNIITGGDEKHVSIGFPEIIINGYVQPPMP
jgi:hypothetical protein